jgi:Uma2 family endonuclease
VQTVWLFEQNKPRVTVVERHGRSWKSSDRGAGSQLVLTAPALTLDVDDIYSVLDDL